MMDLMFSGLVLIALAWLLQLYFTFRGSKEIQKGFIILYILGVVLLVTNDFKSGNPYIIKVGWFELGTCLASLLVLVKIWLSR